MSEQDIRRIVREELAASSAIKYQSPVRGSTWYDDDGIIIPNDQLNGLDPFREPQKVCNGTAKVQKRSRRARAAARRG